MENKSKKSIIIIAIVMCLLLTATIVFAKMRQDEMKDKISDDSSFIISYNGDKYAVSFEKMKSIGLVEKEIMKDTSKTDPTKITYTGIPLNTILKNLNLSIQNMNTCAITSSDGYASAITAKEALDTDNIFIAVKENGKELKDIKKDGDGPFLFIVSKDTFASRWCRGLIEIEFK